MAGPACSRGPMIAVVLLLLPLGALSPPTLAPTSPTRPWCDDGWTLIEDACFRFYTGLTDAPSAEVVCNNAGGRCCGHLPKGHAAAIKTGAGSRGCASGLLPTLALKCVS